MHETHNYLTPIHVNCVCIWIGSLVENGKFEEKINEILVLFDFKNITRN